MPRLTNNEIDKIVDGLTAHIDKRIQEIDQERSDIALKQIESKYSKEVRTLVAKKSPYLKTISHVRINFLGDYGYVNFKEEIVAPASQLNIADPATAQRLLDLKNEQYEINRKLNKVIPELTATLKAIGTHDKLKKEFPEAYAFLPETSKAVPALNLDKIRLDLKTLIK